MWRARVLSIWCPRPSTKLVWSVIPQSFQGRPRSWPGQRFGVHVLPKSQIRAHQNSQFWDVFLHKINFPSQMVNCYLLHTISILKAIVLAVNLAYPGTLYLHPVTRLFNRWTDYDTDSNRVLHITSLDVTGKTQARWLDNMQIPLSRFFLLIQKSFC